jgi:tryptophan-rich sensory protein
MENTKSLIISILIPLGVGALSALLSGSIMNEYQSMAQPPLSPPGWVFPIVWTILYILMGISSWLIYKSESFYRKAALQLYGIQLVVNFFWTIIFFNLGMYLFAFIWLLVLLFIIILMIAGFSRINKTAAYLLIPYLLWVCFAGYLNLGVYLLNK